LNRASKADVGGMITEDATGIPGSMPGMTGGSE
jgi:hypothetical protein